MSIRNERLQENSAIERTHFEFHGRADGLDVRSCLGDIGVLSEKRTPADLASRNELNRAIALGCVAALGKEDTGRRGSGELGPVGRARKFVHVGVSAADERQPVSNRLLSERLFSRGLSVEGAGTVLTDSMSSAKHLP